jgi:hypothetical protein
VKKCRFAILTESALKNLSFGALRLDDRDAWIHFGSPEKLPKSISSQLPVPRFGVGDTADAAHWGFSEVEGA